MNKDYIFSIDVGNTYIKFAVYDKTRVDSNELDKIETRPITPAMAKDNAPCNININANGSMRIGDADLFSNEYAVSDLKKQLRKYEYIYNVSFPPTYTQHMQASSFQILSSVFRCITEHFCNNMAITEYQDRIFRAVLTVPAFFSEHQKHNIILAAQNADLIVEEKYIISEPFAGLFSFWRSNIINIRPNETQTVLVFDLGGGTLDISVLDIVRKGNEISVNELASGGISFGGNDIDRLIYEKYILPECEESINSSIESRFRSLFLNNPKISDEQKQPDHPVYKANHDSYEKDIKSEIMLKIRKYKESICTSANMNKKPDRTVSNNICNKQLDLCYNDIVRLLDEAEKPVKHIKDVLRVVFSNIYRDYSQLSRIFMVGGSSNIKYFQKLISETLRVNEDIFVYSGRMLFSVVTGALCYRILSDDSINTEYNLKFTGRNCYIPFEIGIIEENNGNQVYRQLMSSSHPVNTDSNTRNNIRVTVNGSKGRLNLYRMFPDFPPCENDAERYRFGVEYADLAVYLGYFEFEHNGCTNYAVSIRCYPDGKIKGTFFPDNYGTSFTKELIKK